VGGPGTLVSVARSGRVDLGRTAALRALAVLALSLLTLPGLAGCTSTAGTGVPVVPPSTAPSPTAAPPTSSTATGQQRALPLYYVTDTPAGPRLAREFRRLPVGDDPVAAASAAVTALLAAPSGTVPGHRNPWPPGSALAAPVTHADGVVTVDLDPRAAAAAPPDPILAVQQLVYTVTGALGTADPVRLLVAGESVPRLWNDGVVTGAPIARADPLGIRVLVGIDDPAEGATAPSPLRVTGEAAVFEATLHWEVRRGGAVVRSGTASTAEGQTFAPYSFSVPLPPGDYEIRVAEDDPSDGAGRPVMTDTRRVTVTG
jgi:Immunoglobulin-like domain of bacterial spore germination/Sporulation and spore germination